MTGSRNGTVSLWKDKNIEKSVKISDGWTLVAFRAGRIFAVTTKYVAELNTNLDVVRNYRSRDLQPYAIDANEDYLVVGYKTGLLDVHDRKFDGRTLLAEVSSFRKIKKSFFCDISGGQTF